MTAGALAPALDAGRLAFAWWRRELFACLPRALRRRLTATKSETVLTLAMDGTARLTVRRGGETGLLDKGDLDGLLARHPVAVSLVELPTELALRSTFVLPLAAERNLADAVEFELPRRSPYPPDAVYHAFRVVGRDRANAQLRIELTVAARETVDELLGTLGAHGVTPGRVVVAGDGRGADASPDLFGRGRQATRRSWRGNLAGALAGLAVLLALAAIAVPLLRMEQRADELAREVAAEKLEADQALKLQAEIRMRTQEAGFLGTRKNAAPSPTRVLDALSRLLPDDTWLSALEMKGDEIVITGSTASASAVIALLDRSDAFRKPSFRSPVVQAPGGRQEQFNIAAELAGAAP
jgi:general secretion pathway protein L